jgi:hypothetical protein
VDNSGCFQRVECRGIHDATTEVTDPAARVNFATATVSEVSEPNDGPGSPSAGYCIGNISDASKTWDGRIAHVQIFNRILSAAEMDACLQAPGSVTNGLRLWLPMNNATDINDRSENGFHGIGTSLTTDISGPMITMEPGAIPGVTILHPGFRNVTQHIIPRYHNGVSHPAGQLRGYGPASVIRGTVYSSSNPQPIVATQDFNGAVNHWDYFTDPPPVGGLEAVLQPVIRDLSILGKVDLPGYVDTQGGPPDKVNSNPGVWNPASTHPDLEHGLFVKASAPQIEGVNFFHIAGTCLRVSQTDNLDNLQGPILPFDREKPRIYNCFAQRAYEGFDIAVIDCIVGALSGRALRDYGIKFTSGATQVDRGSSGIHFWGVSSSPATTGAAPAPAVWFPSGAGACWGGPWYPETSDIGMLIESAANRLDNIYTKDCPYGNIKILNSKNILSRFECNIQDGTTEANMAQGILISAQETTLRDGWFGSTSPTPGSPVPNGEIAIRITGTNSGERITLDNLVFFGTGTSAVPMISVEAPLNRSTIVIKAFNTTNGGTLLDLFTGNVDRLGVGNYIWIQSNNVATPIKLDPMGWDNANNEIYVNGVLQ